MESSDFMVGMGFEGCPLTIPGSVNRTPKLIRAQEKSKYPGVLCAVAPGTGMNFVKKGLLGRWKLEGLCKGNWRLDLAKSSRRS